MPVRALPPMAGAVSQAPQHGGYASVAVDESVAVGATPTPGSVSITPERDARMGDA